jgi:hypothetical protein
MEDGARRWLTGVAALLVGAAGCYLGEGVEADPGTPPAGAVGPEASPPTPEQLEAMRPRGQILPSPQVLYSAEPRSEVVAPSVGGPPVLDEAQEGVGPVREVEGQVVAVSREELVVEVEEELRMRLQVTPRTMVLVDGRLASVAFISPGAEVRTSYQVVHGEPMAFLVEARTDEQPEAPPPPTERPPGFQKPMGED